MFDYIKYIPHPCSVNNEHRQDHNGQFFVFVIDLSLS